MIPAEIKVNYFTEIHVILEKKFGLMQSINGSMPKSRLREKKQTSQACLDYKGTAKWLEFV